MGTQVHSLQNTNLALDKLDKVDGQSVQLTGQADNVRTIARHMLKVQEDERSRVARNLHHQVGEPISMLKSTLEKLRITLEKEPGMLQELSSMRKAIDQLDREIDFLALELRPPNLYGGLHAAFSEYVLSWYERADYEIHFVSTGLKMHRLAPDLEVILFRVFQEAMTNIFKHSRAKNVFVSIEYIDKVISLAIEDDGIGFDPDDVLMTQNDESKFGLIGMRERIALVGGAFNIDSVMGQGTKIKVQIPVGYEV